MTEPFFVRDCSLIALSTGKHARTLQEFSILLHTVPVSAIYHHFWGNRLQAQFDEPEFQNDFASWARHGLHDPILSEQLAVIDPVNFETLDDLRREVADIVEQRLAEESYVSWIQAQHPFSFVHSQIVIFDTNVRVHEPEEFVELLPRFSLGSIFFHFIDARRRPLISKDDFQTWLLKCCPEHHDLIRALASVDPYFCTLTELRERLTKTFANYFQMKQMP